MCGIAGVVWPHQNKATSSRAVHSVRAMLDTIRHRGPDGEGVLEREHFCFGHRRLAIIDLQGGVQPMESDDGRYVIVFNGEIYNYIELRAELIKAGESFSTSSDTEVLLKLFARERLGCLRKLNGMFAFAVFDRRDRVFWAARDHFGIKPFYFARGEAGEFCFASEIKALFRFPGISPEAEASGLQQYLTFQFCLGDRTLFKGVSRLEPGSAIEWHLSEESPRFLKYWDLSYASDTEKSEQDFIERGLALLEDSVRLQLRSDVPLGAYLSGGMDSSAISSIAASQLSGRLNVFTGRFAEGPEYDESSYARLVAESIGARYEEIVPSAQDFVDTLPLLIHHMDEPVAGPGLFPQYMVSKRAAGSVKVILGGQGGDEIFGGYSRYQVAYLEQALKAAIFGEQETLEAGDRDFNLAGLAGGMSGLRAYAPMIKGLFEKGLFESADRRYFRLVDRSQDLAEILEPGVMASGSQDRQYEGFSKIFNGIETDSYLNRMLHFDLKTLLPALLQVEDRVSMAVSIESRVPLLDWRLVELIASVPTRFKFKGGRTKALLSKMIASRVPPRILERQDKMGFPVPMRQWLRKGPVRDFVRDVLLSQASRERGIFKPAALERMIDNDTQFGRQLWGSLCLELWHRNLTELSRK